MQRRRQQMVTAGVAWRPGRARHRLAARPTAPPVTRPSPSLPRRPSDRRLSWWLLPSRPLLDTQPAAPATEPVRPAQRRPPPRSPRSSRGEEVREVQKRLRGFGSIRTGRWRRRAHDGRRHELPQSRGQARSGAASIVICWNSFSTCWQAAAPPLLLADERLTVRHGRRAPPTAYSISAGCSTRGVLEVDWLAVGQGCRIRSGRGYSQSHSATTDLILLPWARRPASRRNASLVQVRRIRVSKRTCQSLLGLAPVASSATALVGSSSSTSRRQIRPCASPSKPSVRAGAAVRQRQAGSAASSARDGRDGRSKRARGASATRRVGGAVGRGWGSRWSRGEPDAMAGGEGRAAVVEFRRARGALARDQRRRRRITVAMREVRTPKLMRSDSPDACTSHRRTTRLARAVGRRDRA